jgi:DHA1 family tetracycline resistance protein-like MFS transporter
MSPAAPQSAAQPHAVRFIFLTILIDAMGFGIIMPVMPSLVMRLTGTGVARAAEIGGWLWLAYSLTLFLLGPTMGNLGDRFGRRVVLLGSLAGYGLDYLLMAFAPSLGWLFVGRILAGVFGGSYGPAQAALADLTPGEDRARVFGLVGAAFGLGFVVGPAIGGLLGELGPRAPFFAAAALAGINFVYGLLVFPETLSPEHRRAFDWRRANPVGAFRVLGKVTGLLPVALVLLLWQVASFVYPLTWSFYGIARFGWSPGMIGVSLALVGITMTVEQLFATGRVVARFGERGAATFGMISALLGFVAYAIVPHSWMAFAAIIFIAGQSFVQPSLSAMLSRRVPADQQGEVQGFSTSLMAVGAFVSPLILNPAFAYFQSGAAGFRFAGAAFVLAAIITALALLMLARTRRAAAPNG